MFEEYISAIIAFYEKRMAENDLPHSLVRPTPAKLKKECLAVCNERFQRKDEKVFRDFFGSTGDVKVHLQAIRNCDPDKFRPLVHFLAKETSKTEDKNIELLAWLIDFTPRPYELGRRYHMEALSTAISDTEQEPTATNLPEEKVEIAETPGTPKENETLGETHGLPGNIPSTDKEDQRKRRRIIFWIIVFTSLAGILGFLLSENLKSNKHCMYWSFDRFEKASCSDTIPGRMLVALDKSRLDLRLITKPDTITYKSIGHVWYLKKNKELDYFNRPGAHPIHLNDTLKPISARIIDSHIIKRYRPIN